MFLKRMKGIALTKVKSFWNSYKLFLIKDRISHTLLSQLFSFLFNSSQNMNYCWEKSSIIKIAGQAAMLIKQWPPRPASLTLRHGYHINSALSFIFPIICKRGFCLQLPWHMSISVTKRLFQSFKEANSYVSPVVYQSANQQLGCRIDTQG